VPEVLERLAALKQEDRAAFEALRSQLKKTGCRVTTLEEAITEEIGEGGGRGPMQTDILIDLAHTAELFHTPDGTGFADLDINGTRWTISASSWSLFIRMLQSLPSIRRDLHDKVSLPRHICGDYKDGHSLQSPNVLRSLGCHSYDGPERVWGSCTRYATSGRSVAAPAFSEIG
jgi:hypothetical protein